jgi:DNA-binding MarR family transcriptional regulator
MKTEEVKVDFESSIGPWLGRTVKMVDYHMHEAFIAADLDISKEQMIVLKKLNAQDGLNQNELAIQTFRDKSSLARLLSKMERKNYIFRRQHENDKRVNMVFLTDNGKAIYKKSRPVIAKLIQKLEQNITEAEKQRMIDLLKKVRSNFGEN